MIHSLANIIDVFQNIYMPLHLFQSEENRSMVDRSLKQTIRQLALPLAATETVYELIWIFLQILAADTIKGSQLKSLRTRQ